MLGYFYKYGMKIWIINEQFLLGEHLKLKDLYPLDYANLSTYKEGPWPVD